MAGVMKYPVLETCPAKNHNSLSAARARYQPVACVCTRALELKAARDEIDRRKSVAHIEKNTAARLVKIKLSAATPLPIKSLTHPDFTGAACTTPGGHRIAQAAMNDQVSLKGIEEREAAKWMCGTCPLLESVCRPWVLKEEDPPGSWGGVWAGMDPWNRQGQELIIVDGRSGVIPLAAVN